MSRTFYFGFSKKVIFRTKFIKEMFLKLLSQVPALRVASRVVSRDESDPNSEMER